MRRNIIVSSILLAVFCSSLAMAEPKKPTPEEQAEMMKQYQ